MKRPHQVIPLDEIETLPGPGTLTWRPVRAALGLRAFGTNAYTASEAGVDVVEPHTEDPDLAHEELYFVHAGSARFTIDEETFDAPAGSYVFVPDAASHRHAVSLEAGTTILSFGGPPVFEPSAWEWYFRADALRARGELSEARAVLADGIAQHPGSGSMHYALAQLEAAEGHGDAARAALDDAIERNPRCAERARGDEQLAPLLGGG
jgi:tetratricopeptide (TPR) repeat protein